MNGRYLLLEEVAATARVSVSTVRWWIAQGRLPSIRPGRRRLVAFSALATFLAESGTAHPEKCERAGVTTSALAEETGNVPAKLDASE